MKNHITKYIVMVLIAAVTSCEGVLEEVPESFIAPENFFETEEDALASLYAAYDNLGSGNGVYYRWLREVSLFLSDEGWTAPNFTTYSSLVSYTYDSRNVLVTELWQFSYLSINKANATIEHVAEMDLEDEVKLPIVGEARFIRALNYFNLVRSYGPVPLHLSETNSVGEVALGTSTIEEVYAAIIEDLLYAEQHVGIRVRGSSEANGRADLAAVKMLLAKVYMTMAGYPLKDESKWPLALEKAKELYNERADFGFGLWDNYLDAFEVANENDKEDIFSIQLSSGFGGPFAGEGSLQHIDNFKAAGGRRGNYNDRPSNKLKQIFEASDVRGQAITAYRVVNGTVYNLPADQYQFSKYVEQNIVDNNTAANDGDKNFPVYRYSDLLLMCAEAENMVNGPTVFAYQCLDEVRLRSEASAAPAMDQAAFAEFILDERMRELHNEGHRWFDLIRNEALIEEVAEANAINSVQIPNVPTELNYWIPYPQDELNFNPNLVQRTGF